MNFYKKLFHNADGFLEVRSIDPKGETPPMTFFYEIDDDHSYQHDVLKLGGTENLIKQHNLYFGVHPRSKERGKKQDVTQAVCFFADIDLQDYNDNYEQSMQAYWDLGIKATIEVNSGNGTHLYWIFNEPFDLDSPEAISKYEQYQEALVNLIGADKGVKDIPRILRCPDTTNWPTEKKIAKGRTEQPCVVDHEREIFYNLEDFEELLEPLIAKNRNKPDPVVASQESNIFARFNLFLQENHIVKKIWDGKDWTLKEDGSPDRSSTEFRLGQILKESGFSPSEAASILKTWPLGKSIHRNDGYAETTVAKQGSEVDFLPLQPLEEDLPEDLASEVPLEACLSEELFRITKGVAESLKVPQDFCVAAALPIITTVTGNWIHVETEKNYRTCINLWCMATMETGTRKSSVYDTFLKPVVSIQVDVKEKFQQQLADFKAKQKQNPAKINELKAERKRAHMTPEGIREIDRKISVLAAELEETEKPRMRKMFVDDFTAEGLLRDVASFGSASIISSEGDPALNSIGAYDSNKGKAKKDLNIFLKGYSGETIIHSRASSDDEVIFVPNAILSVSLGAQPKVVEYFKDQSHLMDRGFPQRFLFFPCNNPAGDQMLQGDHVSCESDKTEWNHRIKRIYEFVDHLQDHITLKVTGEANRLYEEFHDKARMMPVSKKNYREHQSYISKLTGATLRLAAVYQVFESMRNLEDGQAIQVKYMKQAINMSWKLLSNYMKAYHNMESNDVITYAKKTIEKFRDKEMTIFTLTDCTRFRIFAKKSAPFRNQVLDYLEECGYIRKLKPNTNSKKPATRYEIRQ